MRYLEFRKQTCLNYETGELLCTMDLEHDQQILEEDYDENYEPTEGG